MHARAHRNIKPVLVEVPRTSMHTDSAVTTRIGLLPQFFFKSCELFLCMLQTVTLHVVKSRENVGYALTFLAQLGKAALCA